MVQTYEVVLIVRADGTDDQIKQYLTQAEGILMKEGGKILTREAWGRRRLAYPIKKQREGAYQLFHVEAEAAVVERWRQAYRLDDTVLRTLILRLNHAGGQPSTTPAGAPTAHEGPRLTGGGTWRA